eukprot:gb/GFBE01024556.1/.p1 GENE.gb/GFBE01024556.1/~~gb/GFBE01024556.1/.p1  ORF type:complete len:701 (+),score=142.91 gb/GFBE01024556.1/:1-2103(+)
MAMRISLAVLVTACGSGNALPAHFQDHLRCPFAKVWLEHGAERAAEILGVTPHRRLADDVYGTCTYTNNFAGGDMCVEFRKASEWTDETAKARCDAQMSPGTLVAGARCDTSGDFAGWCATQGGKELSPSFLGGMAADCAAVKSGCETWSQGTFMGEGSCAPQGGPGPAPPPAGPAPPPGRCALAPGAIGAAHQLASSPGYDFDCKDTPAEKSPYQWPLRWSATVASKGLKFESDEVQYESRGKVMYLLDRNYKRLDMLYQSGVQRAVGQGPCETPDPSNPLACVRNQTRTSTILHRGNRMSFIDYHENGSISSCTWMDLSIIGNIRPDWFMDNRGDSTDVQYIGDSHVYYEGKPKLVKQWRKKDFANQYFTMSMQRLPGADGVHWPLILNVPGEGFGDDFLQVYTDHELLSENDTEPFLIDDAFVAAGGSCPLTAGSGEGADGPPTGQVDHVPSNLEVQKDSWRSIVWTGSPVWKPPPQMDGGVAGVMALTQDVSVETCFDAATSMFRLNMKVKMATKAWAAISWRETEECLMTPRGGGDADLVFAKPESDGSFSMHFGPLSPSMKRFDSAAMASFPSTLTPLADMESEFGEAKAVYENGELDFMFERKYATQPETYYLNFAFGNTEAVGYHKSRGCFELQSVPACKAKVQCQPESGTGPSTTAAAERDITSSGGRRLVEQAAKGGAVMAAFALGASLR